MAIRRGAEVAQGMAGLPGVDSREDLEQARLLALQYVTEGPGLLALPNTTQRFLRSPSWRNTTPRPNLFSDDRRLVDEQVAKLMEEAREVARQQLREDWAAVAAVATALAGQGTVPESELDRLMPEAAADQQRWHWDALVRRMRRIEGPAADSRASCE